MKVKVEGLKVKHMEFKIGDFILVKKLCESNPIKRIRNKLLNIYEEPYKVMDR